MRSIPRYHFLAYRSPSGISYVTLCVMPLCLHKIIPTVWREPPRVIQLREVLSLSVNTDLSMLFRDEEWELVRTSINSGELHRSALTACTCITGNAPLRLIASRLYVKQGSHSRGSSRQEWV